MNRHEMRLYDLDDEEPVSGRTTPAADCFLKEVVAGGAGWVGVDVSGELVAVELDEHMVRRMRPELLGSYLSAAVNSAGERARRKRSDEIGRYSE